LALPMVLTHSLALSRVRFCLSVWGLGFYTLNTHMGNSLGKCTRNAVRG
jgi:hypothetical protein